MHLGARIESDNSEQIAEVRASAAQPLPLGAQPATPKQAPRLGAAYDDRGYLEGRDPRTISQDELLAMGHPISSSTQACGVLMS